MGAVSCEGVRNGFSARVMSACVMSAGVKVLCSCKPLCTGGRSGLLKREREGGREGGREEGGGEGGREVKREEGGREGGRIWVSSQN